MRGTSTRRRCRCLTRSSTSAFSPTATSRAPARIAASRQRAAISATAAAANSTRRTSSAFAAPSPATRPEFRDTEHFFLKLSAFQERLEAWVAEQEHWRPNVRNFTLGYLRDGLQDRAVTRDLTWGVPIPLDGYESKRIYVWFEAVIGYLSAAKQWAQDRGEPEAWRPFWEDGSRAYYFMAKDNIPFHTIIWPAMLMGFGGLALPYDVPGQRIPQPRRG